MNDLESFLNNLYETPLEHKHMSELSLLLESRISQLKGVKALMENDVPNSREFQISTLENLILELSQIREFCEQMAQNA